MLEKIEDIASAASDAQSVERISDLELEFIGECIDPPKPEELAIRIDDITGGIPPKAIDSNPQIAEMLEPIRDQIPPKYLEAPNDMEQVSQISDMMADTIELRPENWKQLSQEERLAVLNDLEIKIAEIEHRPPCPIYTSQACFKETLNTLVHEGRHSYQTYNMTERATHTSQGDLTNWHKNMEEFGYQSVQKCGFKAYWLQPIEADARKFAEDVLTAYEKKI